MPDRMRLIILSGATLCALSASAMAGSFGHVGYGESVLLPHASQKPEALAQDLTPVEAVALAEQSTKGHATHLQRSRDQQALLYRITVIGTGSPEAVTINAASGQIVRTESVGFIEWLRDWEGTTRADALSDTKTTLAAAITTAEKLTGGEVTDAWIDRDSRIPAYELETVARGRSATVHVNATTGHAAFDFEESE